MWDLWECGFPSVPGMQGVAGENQVLSGYANTRSMVLSLVESF